MEPSEPLNLSVPFIRRTCDALEPVIEPPEKTYTLLALSISILPLLLNCSTPQIFIKKELAMFTRFASIITVLPAGIITVSPLTGWRFKLQELLLVQLPFATAVLTGLA